MKIILMAVGGAWFLFALLFVFALVAAAKRSLPDSISPTEPVEAGKAVQRRKPYRTKRRPQFESVAASSDGSSYSQTCVSTAAAESHA